MAPARVLALSLADRQALIPMAAGYLILMSALGFGLLRLYRPGRSGRDKRPDAPRATPPGPAPGATLPGPAPGATLPGATPGATLPGATPPDAVLGATPPDAVPGATPPDAVPGATPLDPARTGWAALRHVAGTVVGGYLLLMAVVVAYYFGVARVGPGFLESAVSGTALLLGLSAPVFLGLSWLADRRRRS
jgi:hypothetical protein